MMRRTMRRAKACNERCLTKLCGRPDVLLLPAVEVFACSPIATAGWTGSCTVTQRIVHSWVRARRNDDGGGDSDGDSDGEGRREREKESVEGKSQGAWAQTIAHVSQSGPQTLCFSNLCGEIYVVRSLSCFTEEHPAMLPVRWLPLEDPAVSLQTCTHRTRARARRRSTTKGKPSQGNPGSTKRHMRGPDIIPDGPKTGPEMCPTCFPETPPRGATRDSNDQWTSL